VDVETFIYFNAMLINLHAYSNIEVFTLKKLKPKVAMDLNFNHLDHSAGTAPRTGVRMPPMNLIPGGPFVPPTMHRAPVHGYVTKERDYNRATVAHMRHEAMESQDCERMEHQKKKGRFF
jgi:hypothetical protein